MLHLGDIALEINDVRGEAIAVLGIRGSGKTNSTAVIVEDVINDIPFTIIDPQGEYYGLKERFDILIAGCGPQVEMQVDPDKADTLAEFIYSNNLSVILDLSGYEKKQRDAFLVAYLRKLWRLAGQLRQLHFILIEEARQFIPQKGSSDLGDLLTDYATMGRKLGLGMIIVNQRSSNISKDVLSQAGILLLHQVAHAADLSIYKDLIPGMTGKQIESTVRGLTRGQAVYVRGPVAQVVSIRERHTFHAGSTPDLVAPTMRTVDAKLLADLQALLSPASSIPAETAVPEGQTAEKIAAIRIADAARIRDLERDVRDRDVTIENLRQQIKDQEQTIKVLNARVYAPDTAGKQPATQKPAPAAPKPTPSPAAAPTLDQAAEKMKQAAAARQISTQRRAIERQSKDLDSLCQKVRAIPQRYRYLLASLIEQPANWHRPEVIAQRFRYNSELYKKMPPRPLFDLKLIDRGEEKGTRRTIYRLSQSLHGRYPDLGGPVVTAKLFAACGVGS